MGLLIKYIMFRLPVVVLGLWGYACLWLLTDGRYKAFLHPKFSIALIMAFVLNCFFMLIYLVKPKMNAMADNKMPCLIMLLPLCFLWSIYGQGLGGYSFSKENIYAQSYINRQNVNDSKVQPGLGKNTILENPDNDVNTIKQPKQEPLNVSILELIKNPDKYKDKPISVEGAVLGDEYMPKGYMFVFRYVIVCCAADARPMGVFIKTADAKKFKPESWVKVTGVFKVITMDNQEVASIDSDSVTQIKVPPAREWYLSLF